MNRLKKLFSNITKLKSETKPLWGKMNAKQMTEHLTASLRMSNGKLIVEQVIFDDTKLPLLKKILLSDRPLPKNFNNPVANKIANDELFKDFESAVSGLICEFNEFEKYFEENPESVLLNPSFGQLNRAEWIQFHIKHFTHHFKQFGLL